MHHLHVNFHKVSGVRSLNEDVSTASSGRKDGNTVLSGKLSFNGAATTTALATVSVTASSWFYFCSWF